MCPLSGVGSSTNQIYRENGLRREGHECEDRSFHYRSLLLTTLVVFDLQNQLKPQCSLKISENKNSIVDEQLEVNMVEFVDKSIYLGNLLTTSEQQTFIDEMLDQCCSIKDGSISHAVKWTRTFDHIRLFSFDNCYFALDRGA